jgi:hypothetical protein
MKNHKSDPKERASAKAGASLCRSCSAHGHSAALYKRLMAVQSAYWLLSKASTEGVRHRHASIAPDTVFGIVDGQLAVCDTKINNNHNFFYSGNEIPSNCIRKIDGFKKNTSSKTLFNLQD